MVVIAEGILRGCQGFFTPVSLGYPLSVFNNNPFSQNIKACSFCITAHHLYACLL